MLRQERQIELTQDLPAARVGSRITLDKNLAGKKKIASLDIKNIDIVDVCKN